MCEAGRSATRQTRPVGPDALWPRPPGRPPAGGDVRRRCIIRARCRPMRSAVTNGWIQSGRPSPVGSRHWVFAATEGAKVDSQGLAFLIQMTALEAECLRGVCHALIVMPQLGE